MANRITEIQKLTNQIEWHHVDSKGNPADIISRGMNLEQLNSCLLWWNGPKWLKTKNWPSRDKSVILDGSLLEEQRSTTTKIFHTRVNEENELFLRFLSLLKLKQIIAYCSRFKENVLHHESRTVGPLTELERAMTMLVLIA